jgi:choline dehydrogenase
MQDHYTARVSYPVVGAQTANERSRGLPLAGEVVHWLITGKGILTYSPSIVAALRPSSRGYVEARSNRPGDHTALPVGGGRPARDHRRAALCPADVRRPGLKQFVREESLPGSQVQSDDELLDSARRNGITCYHASCTCLMGSHPMAVVDDELKVYGFEGLPSSTPR